MLLYVGAISTQLVIYPKHERRTSSVTYSPRVFEARMFITGRSRDTATVSMTCDSDVYGST